MDRGLTRCLRARAGIQEARCEQRTYLKPSEYKLRVQSEPNFTERLKARHRAREVLTADERARAAPQRRCRAELTWGQNVVRQRTKRMIRGTSERFLECKETLRDCAAHIC